MKLNGPYAWRPQYPLFISHKKVGFLKKSYFFPITILSLLANQQPTIIIFVLPIIYLHTINVSYSCLVYTIIRSAEQAVLQTKIQKRICSLSFFKQLKIIFFVGYKITKKKPQTMNVLHASFLENIPCF